MKADLARVLAEELPITQSLGIGVRSASAAGVVLTMPLAANRNHKGTVFAGSLNAVATLAGCSMLWTVLRVAEVGAHVVIQDSTVHYLVPAQSDVTAEAKRSEPEALERALAQLARRGRARVALDAEVRDAEGRSVATLRGRYVIHRRDE
jgi:thioesterase domain-containing protein